MLVALAFTGVYLAAMLMGTGGHLSLPLDDAFIFFQYARQAVAGHPFHYNGGDQASGGVTSLPALLADTVGYAIGFRGERMVLFALLAGGAGLLLSLLAAHRLGKALRMENPWWAPAFIALNGPLLWGLFAGMDIPFFVAPLLWTLASWAGESAAGPYRRRTILWGCLTAASRPEGLLFALILSLLLLLEARGGGHRPAWSFALPVAVGSIPGMILLLATGHPTPSSLAVKGVLSTPGLDAGTLLAGALRYFASILREIFLGMAGSRSGNLMANDASGMPLYLAPLTLLLFLAGALPGLAAEGGSRRPGPFLLAAAALLAGLASASLVVPRAWHWHRYLVPWYAVVLPFAALGLERVVRILGLVAAPPTAAGSSGDEAEDAGLLPPRRGGSAPRGLATTAFLAYVVLAIPGTLYFPIAFAQNSADIYNQQTALALWSRQAIPAGARIALNDAGALRYYGTHTILDLEGLVTPAFTRPARHGSAGVWETLERMPAPERPAYLIVYPNWYDEAFLKPHRLVHQRRIIRQTIAGGNPMNVYEADWSLAGSGDEPSSGQLAGSLAGRRLIDRLDVADLADEKAHGYSFRAVDGRCQGLLALQPGGPEARQVIDGGRVISRDESFRVRGAAPGRDLVIVLRSQSGFAVDVEVDGIEAGRWIEAGVGPGWTESSFTVPGRLVKQPDIRVRIATPEPRATAYSAFHYWFYQ